MTKGVGGRVLGWFIVDEEAEANADAEASAKARADATVRLGRRGVGAHDDGSGFAAVYRGAGVADQERERLARVIGLLESLPAEASVEVKRAIVGASLEAFGVPIDRI